MQIVDSSDRAAVRRLVDRRDDVDPGLTRRVARIVSAVRRSGDEALLRYARRFDGLDGPVEVSPEEMRAGLE
ncbi:MAG: histidinol dehydrogenase, partial [Acidobacteria bacterium]|nr:histidinol dehydrogenase [Acidobacteriota bacterium]